MKVIIPGGSGFVGTYFAKRFVKDSHEVYILTRGKEEIKDGVHYLNWDGNSAMHLKDTFEGADVVINLTGKSVDCRYTEENKRLILESRVDATRAVGEVISSLDKKPAYWMNASSATIYGYSEEKNMTEDDGEIGDDFSMTVCKKWEEAFNRYQFDDVKKVALRITLVMGKDGGVLPVMKKMAKIGGGGKNGSGRQFISWIHEDDFYRVIRFVMDEKMEGPVNIGVPNPVTDVYFNALLRKRVGAWFGPPKPVFALEIGAFLMRTETELLLKSRRVYPQRLLDAGFTFEYPVLSKAFDALI